ncbi:uncharacterized protein HMPREF1541_01723 [Cyphellophora europaea CBS 101466]|uniref:Uncharacterized protein n=1 Tax=Cyphellophora europaea (strain CBS 101466) TaxID=1220924 RepID=W2S1G6_CYPE1|nr:uncharacterized protein HMPREF1541_01723 [Cyphellophora europaea CBS 101466]ETN42566.1 hypothetical protein HMPREF1541_01723 [Cyphellophora europaea CBS 101466]
MKCAIISGGCSGIGLHLARHLLSFPDWRVVVADINPTAWAALNPPLDPNRTIFIETNVASWESHAALLKQAYAWSNEQIDFYAANAGIGDRDSFFLPWNLDAEPTKPDLSCVDVCETANFYALKLFIHYARKTSQRLGLNAKATFNPKLVFTASCVAQYAFPIAPQYAAAKHAVLGFTRAVAADAYQIDNVAVNCIMPAVIDTGILPGGLNWPKEYITPFSTLNRAYEELVDDHGKVQQDGKSDGKDGVVKVGQSVEVALDKLYYRKHVEPPDESQRFMVQDSISPTGLWAQAMRKMLEALVEASKQQTNGQTAEGQPVS